MKVTDKDYYMDQNLVNALDFITKRQSKKWDNVIIIDGDERVGKSTFSWAIAYYLAFKTGKKFTHENIFFALKDMLNFARSTREQVIVWDEAALGALSSDWQNRSQKALIKMLMTCGKYNHTWIFILPSFFELKKYIPVRRSICLIHCYSPDNIQRGYFTLYNKKKMKNLYLNEALRKFENYGKDYNFHGRYTKYAGIINEEEYDKKKDKAILSIAGDDSEKESPFKKKYDDLRRRLFDIPIPNKELAATLKISEKTFYNWKASLIDNANTETEGK